MALRTFYVAVAFSRTKEGHLVAGEAKPCACATAATQQAEAMQYGAAGAVAVSREIDDDFGRSRHVAVLATLGEVPRLDYLLTG